MVPCGREAGRKAKTRRVSFALVSIVMKGMFLLRMAPVEPCSEATKTVVILLTVKPSKIMLFENTVFAYLYIESVGFTEVHFPMYLHGNCMFNNFACTMYMHNYLFRVSLGEGGGGKGEFVPPPFLDPKCLPFDFLFAAQPGG